MILLRIFKNSRSGGVFALMVIALAIFLPAFVQIWRPGGDAEVAPSGSYGLIGFSAMPFYNVLFGAIHRVPVLNRIIALAILLILCNMLIRIGVRYVLLDFRSLMPAIFFLIFSAVLPGTQQVSPALVGSIFYLSCFAILFDVHDKPPNTFSIFMASLVLALGSMFYLKLIWFLPLLWISLGTLRPVNWRELFYPVIAYLLLGFFLFAWYWGVQNDAPGFENLIRENLQLRGSFKPLHFSVYLFYGYFMLVVLVASIYMINRFQARKTVTQNIYQVMFFMFLAGLLFFIFVSRFDTTSLIFISFPITFILANYFHRKKNHWAHETAIWIMIGLLVFMRVMI